MRTLMIENIQKFLDGLTNTSSSWMPLADSAVLITPLAENAYIKGKSAIQKFMNETIFPSYAPDDYEINRHVIDGNAVVTLWNAIYNQTQMTIQIADYFEFDSAYAITKIKPFFDSTQLLRCVGKQ